MSGGLPFISGFLLGGGLIVAIGAQNAFILRQGLMRSHVFVLCLVAALSDAVLIVAGVAGLGTFVRAHPGLLQMVTLGGALFLAVYAVQAARRALDPGGLDAAKNTETALAPALATLFAFTFLNPHVYLDTVVLVGGISAQYPPQPRTLFAAGAVVASFVWFFALGYGARWLAPLFKRASAWRILDIIIAVIMAALAISLLMRAINTP